jgi:carbon-monoxide dehydrogenase large subunit
VVDDVGHVLDHVMVEGQVCGGVAQGVGQAMLEDLRYDPDGGQLLTGSFMDYAMPRATDVPALEFRSNEVPSTVNPLGVKGAGEAGVIGAIPTIVSAVVDALRPYGLRHIDIPLTPERVWRAIHRSKT